MVLEEGLPGESPARIQKPKWTLVCNSESVQIGTNCTLSELNGHCFFSFWQYTLGVPEIEMPLNGGSIILGVLLNVLRITARAIKIISYWGLWHLSQMGVCGLITVV